MWLRLHLQTGFSHARPDSLLLQQSLGVHLIPHFPAGPHLITSHPLFLLKAGLPNALRLSCFVAGEWRQGVLSRWRSDSSSWETGSGVTWSRLPSALLLWLCGEITRKGRRFLPMEPVDMFICKFTPCLFVLIWVCILPWVHSSVLYCWKKPGTNSLNLHGIFKALK